QFLDRHAVHAGTPLVGLDSFQCPLAVFLLADSLHQRFAKGRAFSPALRRKRFGPSTGYPRSFTPTLVREGQHELVFLPLVAHELCRLLAAPINPLRDRSGLHPDAPGLLCPLLTSAARSGSISRPSVPIPGQTADLPR